MQKDNSSIITIDHHQALCATANGKSWSEKLDISVRLSSDAFSSGWYRQNFGRDTRSFTLLIAIVMHARPLKGDDLNLLVRLGMATIQDEGRLYARVTDLGLADELGIHRETIAAGAQKLCELGLIDILHIPQDMSFRDSHGKYAGDKVYLVSGRVESQMEKAIQAKVDSSESADKKTDAADTAPQELGHPDLSGPPDASPIPAWPLPGAQANAGESSIAESGLLDRKSVRRRQKVEITEKREQDHSNISVEKSGTDRVELDGVEILRTVRGVKDKSAVPESSTRRAEESSTVSAGLGGAEEIHTVKEAKNGSAVPDISTHRAGNSSINMMMKMKKREVSSPSSSSSQVLQISQELQGVVKICSQAGIDIDEPVLARLEIMAADAETAARSEHSTGVEWLRAALILGLGVARPASLLNYASKVLSNWQVSGRPESIQTPQKGQQSERPGAYRTTTEQAIARYLQNRMQQKGE